MMFNQIVSVKFYYVAILMLTMLVAAGESAAQFTFQGDFDKSFFAPTGYFVEPQNNFPGDATPNRRTYLIAGELNPDGSIIAGGTLETFNVRGDFWLRKFTSSGAVDTSFGGGNGYVRTIFSTDVNNNDRNSAPAVLKVQPDGKIVMGGICSLGPQTSQGGSPGNDFCLLRFNANGSIDTSFGGFQFQFGGPTAFQTYQLTPGRVWIKSGIDEDGSLNGSSSQMFDMAIQPDGKIIVVGSVTSRVSPYNSGNGTSRREGIIVRFNANGTLDNSFGLNSSGIARWIPTNTGTVNSPCYPGRAFYGVRLQPDGRIIAVGHDGVSDAGCFQGQVFAVTRWNANGTLDVARRLDASTNVFAVERGVSALITNDGRKVLVSGNYLGSLVMTRFNLSDMTLDGSFGTNGIRQYPNFVNSPLYIKAIQPDGKILATDAAAIAQVSRFNPNGSPDNSFGNAQFDGSNPRGRLSIPVNTFNTINVPPVISQILLRPNGKLNLIGSANANEGGNSSRSLVSQNINVSKQNTTTDLTNDGKAEISVFRASTGVWHLLNSGSGAYSSFGWGASGDRLAPADFDGDGKADAAVFRNGTWYIVRSSNNQISIVGFGLAGDLPRPGDFDGDGYADIAVFRPSTGVWYWLNSSNGQFNAVQFGQNGDAPLIADFDGDGKSDVSVFRAGVWYFLRSSNASLGVTQFGLSGDIPVVGDYDGDGKSDLAVFRSGVWYALRSSDGGATIVNWGIAADKPVPGDYDNDGKNDFAVFRNGVWWIFYTGSGTFTSVGFGLATDTPIQSAYLP